MTRNKLLILFFASLIPLIFYFIPTPPGLTYEGKMMLAILLFAAVLFVSEALPLGISGLLVMILPPILGVFPSGEVFSFFGNEAVFFLIGAFILAAGVQKSGLHARFAAFVLKAFGNSPGRFILGVLLMGSTLSFFMSEHAVVALLLPIVGFSIAAVEKGSNFGKASMIALTYGCTAGSVATLMGGARNPYTVAFLYENFGIHVSFLQWVIMALPVTLLMIPLLWLIITRVHPPESVEFSTELPSRGKMGRKEWEMLAVILITIFLLLTMHGWGIAVAVIIGAVLIFLLDIASWRDVEKTLPWGVVLLYGGAMTLGRGLQITGASEWLAGNIVAVFGSNPNLILLVLIVVTIMMTEIMSHAAAVALMLPIGTGIAVASGLSVLQIAMAIALAGGFGYALLVGTPGNLITYSTGYFRQRDIMKTGILADAVGAIIVYVFATVVWNAMGVL